MVKCSKKFTTIIKYSGERLLFPHIGGIKYIQVVVGLAWNRLKLILNCVTLQSGV